jgi:hypothetical protein
MVHRASPGQLAWARMPANECHTNARWYAKNDPTGSARAVSGWWVQWPNFVLHSVVEIEGALICITPSAFNETEFPFILDPKISWVENGEHYSAVRDDKIVGVGVRVFPAFTMAQNAIVRERLLAGAHPLNAGDFTDEEMEELKRKFLVQSTTARMVGQARSAVTHHLDSGKTQPAGYTPSALTHPTR